jgi:hypothetical protein
MRESRIRESVFADLEIDVDLRAVVELADRLGIALVAVVLSVDLVVDGREAGEAIRAFLADNVGLHGVGAGVGEIYDRADYGIIPQIKDFAVEQAALGFVFVVGKSVGDRNREQERAGDESGLPDNRSARYASLISLSPYYGAIDLIHSGSLA